MRCSESLNPLSSTKIHRLLLVILYDVIIPACSNGRSYFKAAVTLNCNALVSVYCAVISLKNKKAGWPIGLYYHFA